MNKNDTSKQLVRIENNDTLLIKANSNLAITDKILTPLFDIRRRDIIELLIDYPNNISVYIAKFYTLSKELIKQHIKYLMSYGLAHNKKILWDKEIIKLLDDNSSSGWVWDGLSNNSLPWSREILSKYRYKLFWYLLSENKSIPWSLDLIEEFKDELLDCEEGDVKGWDFEVLSKNEYLPWCDELI